MRNSAYFLIAGILLAMLAVMVIAPSTPHSIDGYIFRSNGISQVPLGTNLSINVTNSSFFLKTKTSNPVPGQSGRYFETINGTDGDTVIIFAWNATFYGTTEVVLNGTMRNINVSLNLTRNVELNVTPISPINNSVQYVQRTFLVNVSVLAFGADGTMCNVTISFTNESVINLTQGEPSPKQIGTIPFNTARNVTFNVTPSAKGTSNISVLASCENEGLRFENFTRSAGIGNITVQSIPSIALITPANMTNSSNGTIRFAFLPFDVSESAGCRLVINNTLNQSNASAVLNDQHNNITAAVGEGSWLWTVNCTNNDGNTGTNDSYALFVDSVSPIVTLNAPNDNASFAPLNISLNYTATDTGSGLANCSLFGNFTGAFLFNQSHHAPASGVAQSFSPLFLGRGTYFWNVACYDYAANIAWAENRTINVSPSDPDLEIRSGYILFSDTDPLEDQQILVNATVVNQGGTDSGSFVVRFMYNASNGTHIANFSVELLAAGQNVTLNATYVTRNGPNNIFVIVDYNNSIVEIAEDNNEANNTVHVNGYSLYFGNASAVIVLATNNSVSLTSWQNAVTTGNLFAADKDSSINFASLQALGLNITNGTANNDFIEADQLLNMTYFNDSINRMFTVNGIPKTLRNFSTLNARINNVAVINSTYNDTFVSGIVWDTSKDTGNGEYDSVDREPLIFITALNVSNNGKFGTYDFEILVPTNLRAYENPNVDSNLVFYTEIT